MFADKLKSMEKEELIRFIKYIENLPPPRVKQNVALKALDALWTSVITEEFNKETALEGLSKIQQKTIMSEDKQTPTLGEQRVRTTFNPSNESVVDRIKQKSAELIDLLQAVRNDEVSKTYDKTPEQLQAQSGEKLRLISLAQTAYEEAAMWAVKAATS